MKQNNFEPMLEYIIRNETKKTIGMVLERLDIVIRLAKKDNRNYLTFKEIELAKENMKSVIAEQYRNIRDFLKTGKIIFEFKSKEETK